MNSIIIPPGFSASIGLNLTNQYGQQGTFVPPVVWEVDSAFGQFIPHPSDPNDTRMRIFRATDDQGMFNQTTEYRILVQTTVAPLTLVGQVALSYPSAPATQGEVNVGPGFPNS